MSTNDKDRIFTVMATVFEVPLETLNEESSTDTIDAWDSLKHLTLILALEEEFGITIPDEEVGGLVTFKLIDITIREQLGQ
jgi:acyl carrier protein